MRRSNSKETRRAVEAYVLEELDNRRDNYDDPDTMHPVSWAFGILRSEMRYQSDQTETGYPIHGEGLAAKYHKAGRYGFITADTPYWVMFLAVSAGCFDCDYYAQRKAVAAWMDETPEEAERYSNQDVYKRYRHMTAQAFERLYEREQSSMPATIAPALTGSEEFHIVFQQSRMVLFSVSYYTLGNNRAPYFATQACKYNQNKSDIVEGGQAQDRLTTGKIRAFWKKWDSHHLQQLTDEERRELARDLESLKQVYNHIQFTADKAPHDPTISERRTLSMQKISRNAAKEA